MEYGALLFHELNKSKAQKLDRLQYRTLKGALGHRNNTRPDVTLAEIDEPPMHLRFRDLDRNCLTKCFVTRPPMYSNFERSEQDNGSS
jgi:hypothetical protein